MGYYSTARGGFQIDPPITYKELAAAGYDLSGVKDHGWVQLKNGWGELYFILDVEERDTDEGKLITMQTDRVEATDESQKMYEIHNSVETLIADFGDTHKFDGKVVMYGEEDADVSRIRIVQNAVYRETPELMWPNGDREKP